MSILREKVPHYFNEPMVRMGRWSLLPADSDSWHGQDSSDEFRKVFGIGKGTLTLHDTHNGYQHAFFPKSMFDSLYRYIDTLTNEDIKGLEKVLLEFYGKKKRVQERVPELVSNDYTKLSSEKLVSLYKENRKLAHWITVYDQFGWIGEEYWTPKMQEILIAAGLALGSKEYNEALFALSKPEEISTTLSEKREVLLSTIMIHHSSSTVEKEAGRLAQKYGWMPVFTYGTPWDANHYKTELETLLQKSQSDREKEHAILTDYTQLRNKEFEKVNKQLNLSKKDAQVFVDFGLAIDTRNEAEYMLSYCSFYLLPLYKEMAKRLFVSVNQLRRLHEFEIQACLLGEREAEEILSSRLHYEGMGFDESMQHAIMFTEAQTQELLEYLEEHAEGQAVVPEGKGLCASPGKVVGTARIVLDPHTELHKVTDGDILITTATTVDYLPAMKLAAAFVAEVGGLTCHAAVVAREFGVPCVTSFAGATTKFKDGDMVEVDADNGIVRKV